MPEDPLSSPIYTINDDVLLYIVTFNADMFSDSKALHTTRITSQVCRHWRDLMLKSPSLWAKLIDMDQISNCRANKWREELVRRSGAAPLWIRAKLLVTTPEFWGPRYIAQLFFFNLLSRNWQRIQKLVFSSSCGLELTRSMLCFSAPQLEHFHCEVSIKKFQRGVDISKPLFSNQAPMLRSICFCCDLVDPQAPWLGHLHSIVLDSTYSVANALTILLAAHSLQELKIDKISYPVRDITTSTFPIVSLSHLKSLECIVGYVAPATEFLEHIEIPVNCSLSIQTIWFDFSTQEKSHFPSIIKIFT